MDFLALFLFIAGLAVCIYQGISILYALAFGYVVFFCYGLHYGCSVRQLLVMTKKGIMTVKTVLIVFCFIGMITVAWRAGGTIPYIVAQTESFMSPAVFLLVTFLFNAGLSVLIGTSFGTVATMGVITMSIGHVMGVDPMYTGGAVFSGIYFGDRCSPLSTSALVVAAITKTSFYDNLRAMAKSAIVPFIVTCLAYVGLGLYIPATSAHVETEALFSSVFQLHWLTLLPAIAVIVLPLKRIDVRITMGVSITLAIVLTLTLQGMPLSELLPMLVFGYVAPNDTLAPMMNGGGLVSMVTPILLVGLSCSYAGIFEETDILEGIKRWIATGARLLSAYGCTTVVAVFTVMMSCNQTLASILTQQLVVDIIPKKEDRMLTLENTVIVMAPLIPWSIASAVPMAATGAPMICLLFACYLYLQPLWGWVTYRRRA